MRRAIWALLAAGACLPAPAAPARPAGTVGRDLTGVSRAALSGQRTTRDAEQKDKQTPKKKSEPEKPVNSGRRQSTPPKGPKTTVRDAPPVAPVQADPDIFKNIKLSIVIAGEHDAPTRQMNVTLWTRERGGPATPQDLGAPERGNSAYIITLKKGLNRKKDYWVTVTSAGGRLSGEAAVDKPSAHNAELPVRVNLYPAVEFEVLAERAGAFSVVEMGREPSASIPYALEPGGGTTFVKGLRTGADYELVTDNGDKFVVSRDEIKNGAVTIDLSVPPPARTSVKVSAAAEGSPVRDASVTVIFDDSQQGTKTTNEQGVAVFEADPLSVRAVEVDARDYEKFSCGGDDEACPAPEASGALVVKLTKTSSDGGIGSVLRPMATIIFVLVAAVFIVVGVAVFRILLNPVPPPPARFPPAGMARGASVPERTSVVTPSGGAETSSQPDGTVAREPGAAQHETLLTSNEGGGAQPDQSPAAQAYSVPNPLSAEMAKEVYKRWVRREKLTRDPVRLDIVLGNSTDHQSLQFRETKDPGSKFILFTDGESGGWLFPNPAPGVFQTEVEQTWRLVFKDLSKEEFGRKRERLNPLEARRADGVGGKGMWTAEPKPYEFG